MLYEKIPGSAGLRVMYLEMETLIFNGFVPVFANPDFFFLW